MGDKMATFRSNGSNVRREVHTVRRKGLRLMLMSMQDRGVKLEIDDLIDALAHAEAKPMSDLRDIEMYLENAVRWREAGRKVA